MPMSRAISNMLPWFCLAMMMLLSSCHHSEHIGERTYEFSEGYVVDCDSLSLQINRPLHTCPIDTISPNALLVPGDTVAVVKRVIIPEDAVDSVWVLVTNQHFELGWLHESDLVADIIPIDPISQAIHFFSVYHDEIFYVAIGLMLFAMILLWLVHHQLRIPFYRDMPSFYPALVIIVFGAMVVLYINIQRLVPDEWEYYYFHTTLSPFGQTRPILLFLSSFWVLLVLSIATLDDMIHRLNLIDFIVYGLVLMGMLCAEYLLINWVSSYTNLPFILYGIIVLVVAVLSYCNRIRFICGKCGQPLHHKGRCPSCGAINE